jgi:hypothetical protein
MKKQLLWLTLPVLIFSACDGEGIDLTPPSMTFLSLEPQPRAAEICGVVEDTVFHLKGGEELAFEVLFQDDQALSQYKIDIHHNFDCHGHGGGTPGFSIPNVVNQTADWTVLEIVNLAGSEQQVSRVLRAPENVTAGAYHFQLQVIDEAGNDNPFANFYSIKVLNPRDTIAPQIAVAQPSQASFAVAKGNTVRFTGEVTDNYSLSEGGNGVLFLTYTDLNSGNTFIGSGAVSPFESNVEKSFAFDFEFTVPTTLRTGDFRFSLRAHDGVRNVADAVHFAVRVTD